MLAEIPQGRLTNGRMPAPQTIGRAWILATSWSAARVNNSIICSESMPSSSNDSSGPTVVNAPSVTFATISANWPSMPSNRPLEGLRSGLWWTFQQPAFVNFAIDVQRHLAESDDAVTASYRKAVRSPGPLSKSLFTRLPGQQLTNAVIPNPPAFSSAIAAHALQKPVASMAASISPSSTRCPSIFTWSSTRPRYTNRAVRQKGAEIAGAIDDARSGAKRMLAETGVFQRARMIANRARHAP